jgi:integrase
MASITKRKTKGGVRYLAEVQVKGERESKTFDDEIDARIWARDKENSMRTGVPLAGEIASGDMLLYKAMEQYIVESRTLVSVSQIKSYENSELMYQRSFPAEKKMSEVSPQDVSAHVLKRMVEDGVGPSSIRNELSFIRGVYTKAVEWGINLPSPELSIKRPRAKMRSREDRLDNIIKPEELVEIFSRAKRAQNNLYHYLKFLLYTGMRPSEAACLYWERLPRAREREAEKARQPVGFVDLERGGFSKIGTKTEKRFVPGHPAALQLVRELLENRGEGKRLVFLDDRFINKHMAYKYYRRSLETVCSNATDDHDLREGINFYSFRHTFRSRLEECGASTAFAETIIGHSDRSFKFTYIHLSDEALINIVRLLDYGVEV